MSDQPTDRTTEGRIEGSIPKGPITLDTELIFVDGQSFVNAAKHEQVVARHVAALSEAQRERDEARELIMELRECVEEARKELCYPGAEDEHNDSPGNVAFAILSHALNVSEGTGER